MIDVYHFTPSREDIAADRRKALWGRFEQSSKAHYVPPELRPKAIVRANTSHKKKSAMRYRPSLNQARLGMPASAWYAEAKKTAVECPYILGYTTATRIVRDMQPGVVVFSAKDRLRGKHLRNALVRFCERSDMRRYTYAVNVSQELVRVECSAKGPFPDAPEPQGGTFAPEEA